MRTRSRRSGRIALNGYEFQAAHAVQLMTQLLTCERGLVQLRYEGAQDIDLMFGQGSQLFIQYKETSGTECTFDAMRDILHGFMRDTIDACGHPPDFSRLSDLKLGFLLVTTGVYVGPDMLSLGRKTRTQTLAAELVNGFSYDENKVDKIDDTKRVAAYVLENVELQMHPRLRDSAEAELMATGRLALFGVPVHRIGATLARIKALLTPPQNVFPSDVARCLEGLPDFHPASGKAPINMLPSESTFPDRSLVEQEFRSSGRVTWAAIHYELDVIRDKADDISADVAALGRAGGVILIAGAAASGKSTMVRRLAWELHCSGAALVFELTNPSALDNPTWDELVRLAGLTDRQVVLVVDDIGSYHQVLEELIRTPSSGITVIATDKNKSCLPKNLPVHVSLHAMESVSVVELSRLEGRSGLILSDKAKRKLSSLMRHGEMFALSLLVQGSSLHAVADETLQRLERTAPELAPAFLGLCACGANDQTMPLGLFIRMLPTSEVLTAARRERLVFVESNQRVRSGHAVLSGAILVRAQADPTELKMTLLEKVDVADGIERRFGLSLLLSDMGKYTVALEGYSRELGHFIDGIVEHGDFLDIRRCVRAVDAIVAAGVKGLEAAARRLKAAATSDRVRSGQDAIVFLNENRDFAGTYRVVSRVFANPAVTFGRSSFMRWVTEKGRGHPDQQREAVNVQFGWVQRNGYPVPETSALVNCIHQGNYNLSAEVCDEFALILRSVLTEMEFRPHSQPELELLYAICDTIRSQIRREWLVGNLLETVRRNFIAGDLAGNRVLLRHLMSTAKEAGGVNGRRDTLQLITSILTQVPTDDVRSVVMSMPKVMNKEMLPLIAEWTQKFDAANPASVSTLAQEFVAALVPYIGDSSETIGA
jgi:hypothetical protein